MIRTLLLALLTVSSLKTFTEEADALMKTYVNDGQVNYQALKDNANQISQLYQQIGEISLDKASDNEKKAFYINAYNIIILYQAQENYPIESPMNVPGFFEGKQHTVAGEQLTLNALEQEKLLKPYHDPRIHFVLVCAAKSCPPLASFAYQAEQLDQQLDRKTRQALNNPDFVRVKKRAKTVEISKIFEWYKEDFTKDGSTLAFINQYRDRKIPTRYQVHYYDYNWDLNNE